MLFYLLHEAKSSTSFLINHGIEGYCWIQETAFCGNMIWYDSQFLRKLLQNTKTFQHHPYCEAKKKYTNPLYAYMVPQTVYKYFKCVIFRKF